MNASEGYYIIRTIARRTITINNPVNPATEEDMRYKFHKVIRL